MQVKEIMSALEQLAPPALQESYDNAGLILGDKNKECTGVLVTLDTTEEVVEEAISKNCNLIVSHHPVVFRGLKRLTGNDYVERTVISAIKNDIAVYAIHTNLDNVSVGVNVRLASALNLKHCTVLDPKPGTVKKLVTFAPVDDAEKVRNALFAAGAGNIGNYAECSFNLEGTGTFKALNGADPYTGNIGERHFEKEIRIEAIFPSFREAGIIKNLLESHPYEEVAYYISSLDNVVNGFGSGMIGELADGLSENEFLAMVKKNLGADVLRHTRFTRKTIKKVAICGGAGFFLLKNAKAAGADVFVTADIKYHDFFDADGDLLLVDAGHYETEQFTIDLLETYLRNNFPNFAVRKTEHHTNSVHYFK